MAQMGPVARSTLSTPQRLRPPPPPPPPIDDAAMVASEETSRTRSVQNGCAFPFPFAGQMYDECVSFDGSSESSWCRNEVGGWVKCVPGGGGAGASGDVASSRAGAVLAPPPPSPPPSSPPPSPPPPQSTSGDDESNWREVMGDIVLPSADSNEWMTELTNYLGSEGGEEEVGGDTSGARQDDSQQLEADEYFDFANF
mmetsp:Transcript_7390/g.19240  ORF Transcript_7390/g.19240 Transcript_7390/m.19240 type:complete len:198 (-) Transcript_7390:90-683(-)